MEQSTSFPPRTVVSIRTPKRAMGSNSLHPNKGMAVQASDGAAYLLPHGRNLVRHHHRTTRSHHVGHGQSIHHPARSTRTSRCYPPSSAQYHSRQGHGRHQRQSPSATDQSQRRPDVGPAGAPVHDDVAKTSGNHGAQQEQNRKGTVPEPVPEPMP